MSRTSAERPTVGQSAASSEEVIPAASDLQAALETLKGKDAIGRVGDVAGTAVGVAAGTAAAGAIAGALGATTFLGSTTLASVVGGVLITTTPVGWVVGCALVGGAVAYGATRMIRSGAHQDEIRKGLSKSLMRRLDSLGGKSAATNTSELLGQRLAIAVQRGLLDETRAAQLQTLVVRGQLSADLALTRVQGLLGEGPEQG